MLLIVQNSCSPGCQKVQYLLNHPNSAHVHYPVIILATPELQRRIVSTIFQDNHLLFTLILEFNIKNTTALIISHSDEMFNFQQHYAENQIFVGKFFMQYFFICFNKRLQFH